MFHEGYKGASPSERVKYGALNIANDQRGKTYKIQMFLNAMHLLSYLPSNNFKLYNYYCTTIIISNI